MFKAELTETSLMKDCLQAISSLISEGIFNITENGLELVATDPAMVAMVDFTLEKDAFSQYEAKEQHIGISVEKLYTILKRANATDVINLELDEDQSKLVITIHNGSTRTFSLPLLNLDEDNIPNTDDLEFAAELDVKSSALTEGFGDASVVGDSVTIAASADDIRIQAKGDSSHVNFSLPKGADGILNMEVSENVRSMFSLDYLNKMMKAEKLSENVKVKLGNDFPLRLEFAVPEKARLNFVLAPRIEEE